MLPVVGTAIERILEPLHPDLVAVVDARHAGIGHLPERRHDEAADTEHRLIERHAHARLLDRGHALVVWDIAEDGDGALHVMTADEVHHGVEIFLRVVFDLARHAPHRQRTVCRPRQEVQHRTAQRVVHRRVHLVAREVLTRRAVGDLVRRVLPDLTDHDCVGATLLELGKEGLGEGRRQLVDDVQTPARDPLVHPVMEDAVLPCDDEVHVGWIRLVDVWQGVKIPPAVILIWEIAEMVPRVVRRFLRLICAKRIILLPTVEVDAVAPRVAEYAVEDDADAALACRRDETAEILDIAQHGVNVMIVPRIVVMIALGLKHGVEVDARNAKFFEVVEFLHDPAQISAEEVIGDDLLRVGILEIHRVVRPVRTDDSALLAHDGIPRARKAVGEDLIHDAVLEPVRCMRSAIVDRHLIGGRLLAIECADAAEHLRVVPIEICAALHRDNEVVPEKAAVIRQLDPRRVEPLCGIRIMRHERDELLPRLILPKPQEHLPHRLTRAELQAETHPAPRLRRADDGAEVDVLRIMFYLIGFQHSASPFLLVIHRNHRRIVHYRSNEFTSGFVEKLLQIS